MYISKIRISNFRNFVSTEVCLNDGLNILIGPNNSGKTNLLKAISLVIDSGTSKRLGIDDFNKKVSLEQLKKNSPKITISLTINKGSDDRFDDLVMVGYWLTKLDSDYEALLTYEFFLPEKEEENYLNILGNDGVGIEKAWKIINRDFIDREFIFNTD